MTSGSPESSAPIIIKEAWEVLQLIGDTGETVLVGGQALAFWAELYHVDLPLTLMPAVTEDIDFLGASEDAVRVAEALQGEVFIPTLDDMTPSSGRVIASVGGKPLRIDFLFSLIGLAEADVRRQALIVEHPDLHVRAKVMHPAHCLESRCKNLVLLPEKRSTTGIAQAELSVEVVRAHIDRVLVQQGERAAFPLIERVIALALSDVGRRVFLVHQVDPLKAVPVQSVTSREFQDIRWPQICAQVEERREVLRKLFAHTRSKPSP